LTWAFEQLKVAGNLTRLLNFRLGAILSESFYDSLEQLCACIGGADVGIPRILQERDILHRWNGVQPVLLRAHANSDLTREHLCRKLEGILL
jgi:hypothetical protein